MNSRRINKKHQNYYKPEHEFEQWHRLHANPEHYVSDVDSIEYRSKRGQLYMAAVIEDKRAKYGKIKLLRQPQKNFLVTVAHHLKLPLFVVHYRITSEIDGDMPDSFNIRYGNADAKAHLIKNRFPPGEWITEEEYIRFLDSLECLVPFERVD